jgi:CelD/BcsL family acetyltransferase involved in cellulose biosynthesis
VTIVDLPQRGRLTRTPFKVEIFAGADLAAAEWPSVAAPRDLRMYVFQSREFLEVWLGTIGKAGGIASYLVVVRDGAGQPVLYLPLAIETKFNVRLLRFMDCGVADYNAPIVAADCTLSRQEFLDIWSEILSLLPGFDVVDLKKIASDVDGAFNPLTYLDCVAFDQSGHSILLSALRDQADTPRPVAKLRRKLRHYREELDQTGAARFVVDPPESDVPRVTARLFELKRRKYAHTAAQDFLALPGVEDFYRAMTGPDRLGRISQLSALTVGDTVASAHLGFVGRGRCYYIFPAYDTEFSRYRVGHLLLQHLIDRSVAGPFDTFDLGVGENQYKDTWATHHLALLSHERAVTAAGRIYQQMRRVQRMVKKSGLRSWFGPKGRRHGETQSHGGRTAAR